VASLVKDLSRDQESQLTKHYTQNAEAFLLYLKGRYYWNRFTEAGLQRAIEYFNRAIEKDAAYALAYAGLGDCYGVLGLNYQSPADNFPKQKTAVLKALQIDDTLCEAHTSLGAVKLFYEWDWPGAERESKRALELNSGYASAYEVYAYYYDAIGRPDMAITRLEQALEVDPVSPILNSDLGWGYLFTRQYDEAAKQGAKTLEMDPNFYLAHLVIGMAHEYKGHHKKAIRSLRKAAKLSSDSPRVLAWL
jgi:tetratricopeptide (TPR) repeat protein